MGCGQQNYGPPKDVLIPGSSDCVTLYGKKDFADKIKDLQIGRFFGNIQWV